MKQLLTITLLFFYSFTQGQEIAINPMFGQELYSMTCTLMNCECCNTCVVTNISGQTATFNECEIEKFQEGKIPWEDPKSHAQDNNVNTDKLLRDISQRLEMIEKDVDMILKTSIPNRKLYQEYKIFELEKERGNTPIHVFYDEQELKIYKRMKKKYKEF